MLEIVVAVFIFSFPFPVMPQDNEKPSIEQSTQEGTYFEHELLHLRVRENLYTSVSVFVDRKSECCLKSKVALGWSFGFKF